MAIAAIVAEGMIRVEGERMRSLLRVRCRPGFDPGPKGSPHSRIGCILAEKDAEEPECK